MILLSRPLVDKKSTTVYVEYPLCFIEGSVTNQLTERIDVINHTTKSVISWPVIRRYFKIVILLQSGNNQVELLHGYYRYKLAFTHEVKQTSYVVQPLYVVCKDDSGSFQSAPSTDNSISSAVKRIGLGCALLQTFTAVDLQETLGEREVTFKLPIDNDTHIPLCKVFYSNFTRSEFYQMTESQLWRCLAKEIINSPDLPQHTFTKYIAFLSCTRYDGSQWKPSWRHSECVAATKGYVAIGGGGLAVLGTATLHTWPEQVQDIISCFTDQTRVDKTKLLDDSAYRQTYWGNYATGLGSVLHELGHTMDLAHTATGVMARGFDNIHKFFILDGAKPVQQLKQYDINKLLDYTRLTDKLNVSSLMTRSTSQASVLHTISLIPVINIATNIDSSNTTMKLRQNGPTMPRKPLADKTETTHQMTMCVTDKLTDSNGSLDNLQRHSTQPSFDACVWPLGSAIMLRYSRWLLAEHELKGNYRRLYGNSCMVTAEAGIRTAQLYSKCQGQIVNSYHFLGDNPPVKYNPSNLMSGADKAHLVSCDHQICFMIHIRDNAGNFLKYDISS